MRVLGLITGVLMLVAACGGNDGPSIPTPTPVGSSDGQRLFVAKGCAACHGSEGSGSTIAPALFEHSANQITRQVRAGLGSMPIYPPSKISDAELDEITKYIHSLKGEHGHVGFENLKLASFQHHWMALLALENESTEDAVHHVDHVIEVVEGEHRSQMIDVKEQIEAENIHDGAHVIQAMLTGDESRGLTSLDISGGLARSSLQSNDIGGAVHHLDHLLDTLSAGTIVDRIGAIKRLIDSGNLSDAVEDLDQLIKN
jgi:hypothetical protein